MRCIFCVRLAFKKAAEWPQQRGDLLSFAMFKSLCSGCRISRSRSPAPVRRLSADAIRDLEHHLFDSGESEPESEQNTEPAELLPRFVAPAITAASPAAADADDSYSDTEPAAPDPPPHPRPAGQQRFVIPPGSNIWSI